MDSFDRIVLGIIAGLVALIGTLLLIGDRVGAPITDVWPLDGSRPPVTVSIRVDFTQNMERQTVEERFEISPSVEGRFEWQGSSLSFTPDFPLDSDKTYTITLKAGAVSMLERETKELKWSFTPRQPRVVYLAPADQAYRSLYVTSINDDQSPVELFHNEWGIFDFAVRRDGSQVAVTVYAEDTSSSIWVVDTDGTNPHILIDCAPGSCSGPAWSPDGNRLAYERQEIGPNGDLGPTRVWLFDIKTGSTAPVFEDNQVLGFGPAWSSNGQWLAFFDGRQGVIHVVEVDTGRAILIPTAMGEVGKFSPDGQTMIYVDIRQVGRQFFTELYLAQLAGEETGIQPLFEDAEEDQWVSWSEANGLIVFGRRRLDRQEGFGSQMFIYDPVEDELLQVTDDPRYNNLEFQWDPTGRYIVFTRFDLEGTQAAPELWLYDFEQSSSPVLLMENSLAGTWIP